MKNRVLWSLWILLALSTTLLLGQKLIHGEDKQLFMPGPLTQGHHQIGVACEACHREPMGGAEVMQQA